MAQRALVIGESGSGKSTSIRTLDPASTFIINVLNKSLPFKGGKSKYSMWSKDNPTGNMFSSYKASEIIACLDYINKSRKEIKTVIVDDCNYIIGLELFDKAQETGYGKFTTAAVNFKNVAFAPRTYRDDLTVFYFIHPDVTTDIDNNRIIRSKTAGKMIENQLNFEGLFEIVLYCKPRRNKDTKQLEFGFETMTDGITPAKTPMEMFDSEFIPNDLKAVQETINNYFK